MPVKLIGGGVKLSGCGRVCGPVRIRSGAEVLPVVNAESGCVLGRGTDGLKPQ